MSRTADDNTTGKKDLANADAASGPTVTNAQREINSLNSFTGRTAGSVYNVDPAWTNNDVGSATDSLFDRVNTITGEFDNTTGHTHDGTDGNGGTINASNLSGLNYFRAVRQVAIVASGTSATKNVTTEFTGKVADGNATTAGVVTDAPKNKAYLIQASDGTAPIDGSGNIVYSRITESGGTWTLSFYVLLSGVETAYSFPSDQSLQVYFTEVFNLSSVPTFNEDAGLVETGSFVADVPDATTSIRGLISTVAQSFAGDKTFTDALNLAAELSLAQTNDTTSGADVTLSLPGTTVARLTNASLSSIEGVTAPSGVRMIGLFNATTVDVIIRNDSAATAVDGILTGSGTDFTFKNTAAILLIYDTSTQRWRIIGGGASGGGGSGSGGINYIENPDAETDVSGYVQKKSTTPGSRPEASPGGTPDGDFTLTRSTSGPLRGVASFELTKTANNRQGNEWSYALTIDEADKAKVMQISGDYQIGSGTYSGGTPTTDSDVIIYIRRTTATARTIEPSVFKLDGAVVGQNYSFRGEFQTDSDATGYELVIYQATTTTNAYTIKFDNIVVGPSKNVNGTIASDQIAYTPTFEGFGTPASSTAIYSRDGKFLNVQFRVTTGTNTATLATISLPSGLVLDTSLIGTNQVIGDLAASATPFSGAMGAFTAATNKVYFTSGSADYSAGIPGNTWANGTILSGNFRIPVVGWGATATLGQDADTRVAEATYSTNASGTYNDSTLYYADFEDKVTDSHGAVLGAGSGPVTTTNTGWRYIVPVAGRYSIDADISFNFGSSTNYQMTASIFVDGVEIVREVITGNTGGLTFASGGCAKDLTLRAGQRIEIGIVQISGGNRQTNANGFLNTVSITRAPGPAQVAAPEVVSCKYINTAGTSITSSVVDVPFATKVFDSHNAFNGATGIFTAPAAGKYRITGNLYSQAVTLSTSQAFDIRFKVTSTPEGLSANTAIKQLTYGNGASIAATAHASEVYDLVIGNTLQISAASDVTVGLSTTSGRNFICIERIGGIG